MKFILAVLRSLLARTRFEREMREELRIHIQHRADDLAASGMPHDEALRRARVEFGALESYKEQCRGASGFAPLRPLHGLGGDLKLAARRLAAAPLFTLFAVFSLAIGLAVTTAAYSLVASLFFTHSGIPDEEGLASVMTAWDGHLVNGGISTADVVPAVFRESDRVHVVPSVGGHARRHRPDARRGGGRRLFPDLAGAAGARPPDPRARRRPKGARCRDQPRIVEPPVRRRSRVGWADASAASRSK